MKMGPGMMRRLLIGLGLLALAAGGYYVLGRTHQPALSAPRSPEPEEATSEQVEPFCGACHAYPPPDSFPRSAWRKQVKQGYEFFRASNRALEFPSIESVARYYEQRAPLELPLLKTDRPSTPPPVKFERVGYP